MTAQVEGEEKRHPMLRVLWKPDAYGLGTMKSDRLSKYLTGFMEESHSAVKDEGLLKLGASLSLLAHKNSGLRILELGNDINAITHAATGLLGSNEASQRFRTYTVGSLSENGELLGAEVDLEAGERQRIAKIADQTYDLVFMPFLETADTYLQDKLATVRSLRAPAALILAMNSCKLDILEDAPGLESVCCPLSEGTAQITIAHGTEEVGDLDELKDDKIIVVDRSRNPLGDAIIRKLSVLCGRAPTRLNLGEVTEGSIPLGSTVFCLAECQVPLMSTILDEDMAGVKFITNNAKSIVWVTGGNFIEGFRPEFALISGIARALALEQPSVCFYTYDIDDIYTNVEESADNLIKVLNQSNSAPDEESVQRQGVVHVSRYVPDDNLNNSFRQQRGDELVELPLSDVKPAKLSIKKPGQFSSIYFNQIELPDTLDSHAVQVQVKAIGLNARDHAVFTGKVDSPNSACSLEYSGVVERVGAAVSTLKAGDRVVAMAPSQLRTTQIVPDWSCQKLLEHEDFKTVAGLPLAFATAIYALHDRARIQNGESVLIHSGASAVGSAAIQIAKLAGAEVFTTMSSAAKREYLIKAFGLKSSSILNSQNASFLPAILDLTHGKGVDVVLNTLSGDLLHAGWRCCGSFGRFVELGKRDLASSGRLEMDQFLRNVTFTAFDLTNLYDTTRPAYQAKWTSLLEQVIALYREKKISPMQPLQVFGISNIASALRGLNSRDRIGKIAISLEDDDSKLQAQPPKYKSKFSLNKSYIMIGCLGGLGCSISKWMMSRGARKFVFLGRSGLDKGPARRLVEELERNGADCKVVRGDVCCRADIDKVVERCDGPIGGIVQAAMGLNVGFSPFFT